MLLTRIRQFDSWTKEHRAPAIITSYKINSLIWQSKQRQTLTHYLVYFDELCNTTKYRDLSSCTIAQVVLIVQLTDCWNIKLHIINTFSQYWQLAYRSGSFLWGQLPWASRIQQGTISGSVSFQSDTSTSTLPFLQNDFQLSPYFSLTDKIPNLTLT